MATLPMPRALEVSTRRAAPLDADTSGTEAAEQIKQPDFITTASLATFAGGSVGVTIVWKVAIAAFGWDGRWFPAVLAGILGLYFFLRALESGKRTPSGVLGAFIIAVVNACVLWAAAVGVDLGLAEADIADSAASG